MISTSNSGQPGLSSRESRTKLEVPPSTSALRPGQEPPPTPTWVTSAPTPVSKLHSGHRSPPGFLGDQRFGPKRRQELSGGSAAISSAAAGWLVSFASATAWAAWISNRLTTFTPGIRAIRATHLSVFSFTNLNEEPSSLLALLLCKQVDIRRRGVLVLLSLLLSAGYAVLRDRLSGHHLGWGGVLHPRYSVWSGPLALMTDKTQPLTSTSSSETPPRFNHPQHSTAPQVSTKSPALHNQACSI